MMCSTWTHNKTLPIGTASGDGLGRLHAQLITFLRPWSKDQHHWPKCLWETRTCVSQTAIAVSPISMWSRANTLHTKGKTIWDLTGCIQIPLKRRQGIKNATGDVEKLIWISTTIPYKGHLFYILSVVIFFYHWENVMTTIKASKNRVVNLSKW